MSNRFNATRVMVPAFAAWPVGDQAGIRPLKDGFIVEYDDATPTEIAMAALAGYSVYKYQVGASFDDMSSTLARYPWRVKFGPHDLNLCYHTELEAWGAAHARLQYFLDQAGVPG